MNKENKKSRRELDLTPQERNINMIRSSLLTIPYIGSGIERLFFGKLDELRWRRIELTLKEISKQIESHKIPEMKFNNEYFANFLESVAPALGKAINEDKRRHFRDLMTNVIIDNQNDGKMDEANLCARLLDEIDAPGLKILACAYQSYRKANFLNKLDRDYEPTGPNLIMFPAPSINYLLSSNANEDRIKFILETLRFPNQDGSSIIDEKRCPRIIALLLNKYSKNVGAITVILSKDKSDEIIQTINYSWIILMEWARRLENLDLIKTSIQILSEIEVTVIGLRPLGILLSRWSIIEDLYNFDNKASV